MSPVVPSALSIADSRQPPPIYSELIERTRRALKARLTDAPAGDLLREYVERGKMLRAFLVFAASHAVDGNPRDVMMAAEAIELLHNASLIHDDIIDGADVRRGLVSLHEQLGIGRALVVGDDLLMLAFAALGEASASHPASRVLEAIGALNECARDCCRGQFDELCADTSVSLDRYLQIVRGKTSAPFVAAGVLGVVLGGGTAADVARIQQFAGEMGVAFQIGDDVLDLVGEARALGKPAGNSLAHHRPILPLVLLWQSGADARDEWERLDATGLSPLEVRTLLDGRGIFEGVRQIQQHHVDAAVEALEGFANADGAQALRALASCAGIALPVR